MWAVKRGGRQLEEKGEAREGVEEEHVSIKTYLYLH